MFGLIILGAVLCSVAPAFAVTYIVDGIPLDKYDSAVDKDMVITVTFVKIDDPKDSFLWYKKKVDIDITKIEPRILYGDTRDVISSTAFPAAATGYRMRTTPDPFVSWTTAMPIPNSLVLFATGLGALGFLSLLWKRKAPENHFSAA